MRDDPRVFSGAISKSVESNLPHQTRSVYRNYEIRRLGNGEPGLIYIYSPPPPMNMVEHEATDGSGTFHTWDHWEQDHGIDEDYGYYNPLDYSGLFLEFATLYEDEPTIKVDVAVDKALDWAQRWGLLGPPAGYSVNIGIPEWLEKEKPEDRPVLQAIGTDRCQNAYDFYLLAREANRCLRLYEATTADEDEVDVEALRKYGAKGETTDQLVRDAREKVGNIVQKHLENECYPQLYYNKADNTLRPTKGWGFRSLLGAMYLHMMFLVTAPRENRRVCKLPGCTKIIDFDREKEPKQKPPSVPHGFKKNDRSAGHKTVHSNKIFCSRAHRYKYNYYYRKKKR